jgi:hypothetical protein
MADLLLGMAYLLPWPVCEYVLDAEFLSRLYRKLLSLLVSSLLQFAGCVGKVEGLVWVPVVSEISVVTEFVKCLLVRIGEEMVI